MSLTRSQFEEELEKLQSVLLSMGAKSDFAVGEAMRALEEGEVSIAEDVLIADDEIDAMDLEIEKECLRLIALQHPNARDLRRIGTAIKIITDLERIGDHAVDIAKVARKLAQEVVNQPLADLPKMAAAVRRMLKDALLSFVRNDIGLVEAVIQADDEVDDLFHSIRNDLHSVMRTSPDLVVQASYLLFVAYYLERIADHAVNIAERVHYVETGQLLRLDRIHKAGA